MSCFSKTKDNVEIPDHERPTFLIGRSFKKRWRIGEFINIGVHSNVHEGVDLATQMEVAIKVEPNKALVKSLAREIEFYKIIHQHSSPSSSFKVPYIYDYGNELGHTYIVMQRLDESVSSIFENYKDDLSTQSIVFIGFQLLNSLEIIHSLGLVHGNICTSNVLMENDQNDSIYFIDFGCFEDVRKNNQTVRINPMITKHNDLRDIARFLIFLFAKLSRKNKRGLFKSRISSVNPRSQLVQDNCINVILDSETDNAIPFLKQFWDGTSSQDQRQDPDYNFFRGILQDLHWDLSGQGILKKDRDLSTVSKSQVQRRKRSICFSLIQFIACVLKIKSY